MNISSRILKLFGWNTVVTVPDYPKCIICVAPHTSNWDFVLGKLAYTSIGRKSGFLMKEAWFFFPLGYIFRALGGIPVPRKKGSDLAEAIVHKYNEADRMVIAVTHEGTRSKNPNQRKGFIYIALGANIPIVLAYIDYAKKEIGLTYLMMPSGNVEKDLESIQNFYKNISAKYPEKFSVKE